MPDDGHAIKLVRAAGVCRQVTDRYQDRDWVLIRGDDTWAKINNLILDSLHSPGEYWVRSAGLDEAWTVSPSLLEFPPRIPVRPSLGRRWLTHTNEKGGPESSSQAVTLRERSAGRPCPWTSCRRDQTSKFLKLGKKSLCSRTISTAATLGHVSLDEFVVGAALSAIVYYLCMTIYHGHRLTVGVSAA